MILKWINDTLGRPKKREGGRDKQENEEGKSLAIFSSTSEENFCVVSSSVASQNHS